MWKDRTDEGILQTSRSGYGGVGKGLGRLGEKAIMGKCQHTKI